MKTDLKEYVGMSKEDEKYLKEFNIATERGIFEDKLVKIPKNMKKMIQKERNSYRRDLMFVNKRSGTSVDGLVLEQKPYVGKKKVVSPRDISGKFIKKDEK